jgi:serine/threonine protein kinase
MLGQVSPLGLEPRTYPRSRRIQREHRALVRRDTPTAVFVTVREFCRPLRSGLSSLGKLCRFCRVEANGVADYTGQHHRYESAGRIGHGGMAEVYEGWAKDDPTVHVALKVPLPHLSREGADLFLREAQAAQRVSGPHVVPVVDWGQSPDFIAFEFIDGPTLDTELHTWQREQRVRGDRELVPLFRQLVAAMKAINTQVIHRDLKPANIFVVDGS